MSQKLEDFDVISVVGTGSFGTCYKIRHKVSKQFYVWKAIDYGKLSEEKKKLLVSEVNLLSQLHHPNIVEYFDRIVRKETSTLYIIMEWCQGGDLSGLIRRCRMENKKFDEPFIWKALIQISKALQVCHTRLPKMTLLHRDIKPANIFIDFQGNFKLGDFGLAQSEDDCNSSDNIVGTPYYMSPEIIRGKKYDRKSDIWALGCLIYELCTLVPPFRGVTLPELVTNIKAGRYPPIPEFYSEHLHTVVTFMLTVKREFRPTVEMIIHHPLVVAHVTSESYTDYKPSQVRYNRERPEEKIQEWKNLSKGISNISLSQRNPEEISEALFKERWFNRLESLRERESKLREREEILSLKEESLNNKEKYLSLLEKRTKERMTQAQLYLSRKKGKLSNSIEDMSDISADPGDTSILPTSAKLNPSGLAKPCFLRLSSSRKTVASKHVHFERKPLKESGANMPHLAGDILLKKYLIEPRMEEIWLEQKRSNFQTKHLESMNKENVSTIKNIKKTK